MLFRPNRVDNIVLDEVHSARTNIEDAWVSVDPSAEPCIFFLRMNGIFYCRAEFSAPWGLLLPPMKGLSDVPLRDFRPVLA